MRIFLFAFRISKFSGRKKHIIIFVLSLFLKREYFLFSKNTRINYVIYILLFIIDAMYIFFFSITIFYNRERDRNWNDREIESS